MRFAVVSVLALAVAGCAPSPYDYALTSYQPVEPPPVSGPTDDIAALLPYDASPWFDDDEIW